MSIIMRFITATLPETFSVKAKAEATHHLFKVEPTSTSALDRADLAKVASEPELKVTFCLHTIISKLG